MSQSGNSARKWATQVLYQVVVKQQHLKAAMSQVLPQSIKDQDRAWIQNACYQTLRHHQNLSARWQKWVNKPIKDRYIGELLTLSMAQKLHTDTPDHAIVNEAVTTTKKLNKKWASGLVNAVLKQALKDDDFEAPDEAAEHNHSQWWIDLLKKDWPEDWAQIIHQNNQKPPLWVRTKNSNTTLKHAVRHADLPNAWLFNDPKHSDPNALAGGQYSVQDAAAQWAAHLLKPQDGEYILDACAAPGGKSCHLLELAPGVHLDVLEKEPDRLRLIKQNMQRLGLQPTRVILGDATRPEDWYQNQKYDKILLDVPCSASGVVRRNPDIKLMRQAEHLKPLTQLQQQILQTMAHLVKPGGQILYATCSVFAAENARQIKKFLNTHPGFSDITPSMPETKPQTHGNQILPGTNNMDGFYYCLLQHRNDGA